MAGRGPGPSSGLLALSIASLGLIAAASVETPTIADAVPTGPYASLDPPVLEARLGRGRIAVRATTASPGHEQAVYDLIAERFVDHGIELAFTPGVVLPESWHALTLELLKTLADFESAEAALGPAGLMLRGVTAAPDAYAAQLATLHGTLPSATPLDAHVTVVASELPLSALCESAFDRLAVRPVAFERASDSLRPSSHAFLDSLIELAHDCPGIGIAITGHSDASGEETWNIELSRRRAQAVAAYMVRGGIGEERLSVAGLGSAAPIGDNTTAYGRRLNRRIEFSLR